MDEQKAREDLEFIKNIIKDAEQKVVESGVGFIVWGIIVTIGLLSTYLGIKFSYDFVYGWNWIILIGGGWVYTIIDVVKKQKARANRTFANKILGFSWFGCGIAMTMLGFIGTWTGAYHGVYISPLLSTVLGMTYIITGIVLGKNWVSWLSAGWWAGAMIMFLWPYLYTLLFMAGMIIFLQIVPGIILYLEVKKTN